ncbi:hypothetical protein EDB81DRAFT_4379 [Dactylonectria macrodidyma]|uniref:Uncharacterized protein n=1 Tax=Dactylonectria macrodidyma TaxID=307937 RepID=A0A9P9FQT5_9HYPO|nr:hypothetical protein EDB81DRAFT_4379 [Dactylonectria macrodidyma]
MNPSSSPLPSPFPSSSYLHHIFFCIFTELSPNDCINKRTSQRTSHLHNTHVLHDTSQPPQPNIIQHACLRILLPVLRHDRHQHHLHRLWTQAVQQLPSLLSGFASDARHQASFPEAQVANYTTGTESLDGFLTTKRNDSIFFSDFFFHFDYFVFYNTLTPISGFSVTQFRYPLTFPTRSRRPISSHKHALSEGHENERRKKNRLSAPDVFLMLQFLQWLRRLLAQRKRFLDSIQLPFDSQLFGGAALESVQARARSTTTRHHAKSLREKLIHGPGGFAGERRRNLYLVALGWIDGKD